MWQGNNELKSRWHFNSQFEASSRCLCNLKLERNYRECRTRVQRSEGQRDETEEWNCNGGILGCGWVLLCGSDRERSRKGRAGVAGGGDSTMVEGRGTGAKRAVIGLGLRNHGGGQRAGRGGAGIEAEGASDGLVFGWRNGSD